jgi:hypothetical protein
MQQDQSSKAHGTKPSAVEDAIFRSPFVIDDGVGSAPPRLSTLSHAKALQRR